MSRFIILSSFLLTIFILSLPKDSIRAANYLDVVINEIAWMGAKVEGVESKNWWRYEWLELYNNTDDSISLTGWKIELYRTGLDWPLELNGVIPSQDYFLIVASDKISSNYDLNYSNLGGKFINSGQKVLLKDNSGNIIDNLDCFSYGKWFAGDKSTKQTMERKNPQISGNNHENWANSQNPGGTPKTKNSVSEKQISQPEPQSLSSEEKSKSITYPSGIIINEILPDPKDDAEGEYIEIFNKNKEEFNISGWKIEDTVGVSAKTYIFPEPTIIGGENFLVFYRRETGIMLNNLDGDRVKLLQPTGKIASEVSYEKAQKGQSYNNTESGWAWSATLTPGLPNVIPTSEIEKTENEIEFIEEARKIDINIASPKELQKIVGIGPFLAQRIIEARPFYSLEEIGKVKGIGPKTLEDIKKQGLAWVDPELEPPKNEKTESPEKGLAAVAEPFKEKSLGKEIPKSLSIFLIALALAIFSGITILILKKRVKS